MQNNKLDSVDYKILHQQLFEGTLFCKFRNLI